MSFISELTTELYKGISESGDFNLYMTKTTPYVKVYADGTKLIFKSGSKAYVVDYSEQKTLQMVGVKVGHYYHYNNGALKLPISVAKSVDEFLSGLFMDNVVPLLKNKIYSSNEDPNIEWNRGQGYIGEYYYDQNSRVLILKEKGDILNITEVGISLLELVPPDTELTVGGISIKKDLDGILYWNDKRLPSKAILDNLRR